MNSSSHCRHPLGRREPDVAHPGGVPVESRDERLGLGGRDERQVVAQTIGEGRRFSGCLARRRWVSPDHFQRCLEGEDPDEDVVSPDAACDRGGLRGRLEARRVVALDDGE